MKSYIFFCLLFVFAQCVHLCIPRYTVTEIRGDSNSTHFVDETLQRVRIDYAATKIFLDYKNNIGYQLYSDGKCAAAFLASPMLHTCFASDAVFVGSNILHENLPDNTSTKIILLNDDSPVTITVFSTFQTEIRFLGWDKNPIPFSIFQEPQSCHKPLQGRMLIDQKTAQWTIISYFEGQCCGWCPYPFWNPCCGQCPCGPNCSFWKCCNTGFCRPCINYA